MGFQVLRICRSPRLDMGLKRDIRGSVGRYDPWGIKATGFAVTRKIRHYAAVTW